MKQKTVKRSYYLAEDVIELFDRWVERTGMSKQIAVQLGIWTVVQMDPLTRQQLMDSMLAREQTGLASAVAAGETAERTAEGAKEKRQG